MRSCGLSSPPTHFFSRGIAPLSLDDLIPQAPLARRPSDRPTTCPSPRHFTVSSGRNREEIKGGLGGKRPFPPSDSAKGFAELHARVGCPSTPPFGTTRSLPPDHNLPLPGPVPGPDLLSSLSPQASWFILLWRVQRDPKSRGPMMVWERGDLFSGSRVRRRPEWCVRGSPRGSTRPPGTCLQRVRLSRPPPVSSGRGLPGRTPPHP
jgi:hypothetical protein